MPAPYTAHAIARIKGEIHGQQTVNVMHFGTSDTLGGGAPVDWLLELAVAVMLCVEDTLLPAVTQDWNVTVVETQYIGTLSGTFTTDPVVQGPTGAGVGALGPTSVSFAASLLQLRSGMRGRRGRGRAFLPPPGEAQVAASTIDDPTVALLIEFANCLIEKFVGLSATERWRLGVYSRTLGGSAFSTFDNAFSEVTQLTVANKLAVIGRRKVGHGD